MMRKLFISVIIAGFLLTGVSYGQTSSFGLGVILGEPTGISAKLMRSGNSQSINLAAAWSIGAHDRLYLKGDYVFYHDLNVDIENGRLPVYYGVGAMAILEEESVVGARIPFGLDYFMSSAPLDFFIELAPVVEVLPSTGFSVSGGLGFHYFF